MNNTLMVRGFDDQSLNNAQIHCPSHGVCKIECNAPNACDHSNIYGSNGTILNITANGTQSLQSAKIYCPQNGICNIICIGYRACFQILIGMNILLIIH